MSWLPGVAQVYLSGHFTTADGLPSNTIYCVYRDHDGFLWFGTDMGVVRYNGLAFEHFTTADGLPDNEIFLFHEDRERRLWMGTYNGQLCYFSNGVFHTAANTPMLKLPFEPFHITKILAEKDSSVTVHYRGVQRFINFKGNKANIYNSSEICAKYGADPIFLEKKGPVTFRFIYKDKVVEANMDNHTSLVMPHGYRDLSYCPGSDQVYCLSDKQLYSADGKALASYSAVLKKERHMTDANFITYVHADTTGYYICCRDGMFINNAVQVLEGRIVTGAERDLNGHLWVTTYKDGIYKFNGLVDDVTLYKGVYSGRLLHAQYFNDRLYFITSDADNLWSFSHGRKSVELKQLGYTAWKVEMERWANFRLDARGLIYFTPPAAHQVTDSLLGMSIVEHGRKAARRYYKGWNKMVIDVFWQENNIYVFDNDEIFLVDYSRYKDREPVKIVYKSGSFTTRILGRAADAQGNIWFSTNTGMYQVRGREVTEQPRFSQVRIRKFTFLGNLMVGYDSKNNLFVADVSKDAHPRLVKTEQNYILGRMHKLDDRHLLIATNKYYQLFSVDTAGAQTSCTVKPVQLPLLPGEADYVYADATHCFFCKNGDITAVKLSVLFAGPPPPKVLFTKFGYRRGILAPGAQLTIPQRDAKNISIEFTGISFSSPDVTYQYSVTGDSLQTDWQEISSNTISFPALGYGRYFFRVRAKGPASGYSAPDVLQLTVLRPFYLAWWFIGGAVLLAVALLVLVTRYFVRRTLLQRRKEYEANMRYHNAEYTALNALMNPHFIFNSLNNIQGLIAQDNKQAATDFLANFSVLVRQNMQNISKGTVSLQEELDLIRNYLFLEQMRFDQLVNYRIAVAPDVETELIRIPPLLIQPLVENAIRHGILPRQSAGGLVTVRVYGQDRDVLIEIIDNGVGYLHKNSYAGSGHESYGLSNLSKRTSYAELLHKQRITFTIRETTDEAGHTTGTIATLRIEAEPAAPPATRRT